MYCSDVEPSNTIGITKNKDPLKHSIHICDDFAII